MARNVLHARALLIDLKKQYQPLGPSVAFEIGTNLIVAGASHQEVIEHIRWLQEASLIQVERSSGEQPPRVLLTGMSVEAIILAEVIADSAKWKMILAIFQTTAGGTLDDLLIAAGVRSAGTTRRLPRNFH